ncbi:MAG: DUF2147 domain-containing protein [Rhodomicrobium sp.]|nr:DUF2147 domain-containing protein [Rhodomicrobium sp.]
MKKLLAAGVLGLLSASAAFGQSPAGEWAVEDGTAHIRIAQCGNAFWGVIAWTKGPPGRDENNPDPAKRGRPVMGMPILINMQPSGNRWDGEVYNAENGQTYTSHISLQSPDVLRIEGCVLGGLICGGESWKRIPLPAGSPSDQAVCSGVSK